MGGLLRCGVLCRIIICWAGEQRFVVLEPWLLIGMNGGSWGGIILRRMRLTHNASKSIG